MNLCWVTLQVSDLDRAVDFYHGVLGLRIDHRIHHDETDIVMLGEEDGPKVELVHSGKVPPSARGVGISLGLQVESLDDILESLKNKGVAIASGPFSPTPHVRFFYVDDPDGFAVQLVEGQ